MQLNIVNKTVVVAGAKCDGTQSDLNTRFGSITRLSDKSFKFTPATGEGSLIVERVCLEDLFKDIPQDITGIDFQPQVFVDLKHLETQSSINTARQEELVDNNFEETLPASDYYGNLFVQWKRMVGIRNLNRAEVELGVIDNYLVVDARNAVMYKGVVRIKFKEDSVE